MTLGLESAAIGTEVGSPNLERLERQRAPFLRLSESFEAKASKSKFQFSYL
jgi:hypothetical protein